MNINNLWEKLKVISFHLPFTEVVYNLLVVLLFYVFGNINSIFRRAPTTHYQPPTSHPMGKHICNSNLLQWKMATLGAHYPSSCVTFHSVAFTYPFANTFPLSSFMLFSFFTILVVRVLFYLLFLLVL